jgi:hypothetical protein
MTLFADGEPLDVDKLNELAEKVEKLSAEFALSNRSYDSNTKRIVSTAPIVATGSVKINAGPNSTGRPINITNNVFRDDDSGPFVFVTAGDAKGQGVTFSVYEITKTSFVLDAHADKPLGQIEVNWMAVAIRTLSNS